ncbi:conserved hypothetical protein [Altererythrobacter sp. B11]|uniref:DUF5672 family protein n=1 Tax=Altererythrobacter sp. B11 TaxID=2060312 RepID=UPI000DC6FBD3|nr:DUF5672 family protein [Altererythrobacter sp. B11]BBC71341.1 conserved hypothetical protein [Altererythrobacter sp. B11]
MRLALPDVTLCAVASVNVEATIFALRRAMALADFRESLLFSDARLDLTDVGIRLVPIERIGSSAAYSSFVLTRLADYVASGHCLLVQWDGFPTHSANWDPAFLDCDYIGAPWPQFADGYDVGNGGFSLRSRRLMHACREPGFARSHPEDVAIGRINRPFLEARGLRFADSALAARFSRERSGADGSTFGFHGAFNMIDAIGTDLFWTLYEGLDDRTTVWRDAKLIARQLRLGDRGLMRSFQLRTDAFVKSVGTPR